MRNWTYEIYNEENYIKDYDYLYSKLSKARREKVDKANIDSRKAEELMAGSLLEDMLQQELGSQVEFEYYYSDRQKPFLKNSDLFFSISHTAGVVACGISDKWIGIDVERRGRYKRLVAEKYFSEQELDLLRGHREDLPDDLNSIDDKNYSAAAYAEEMASDTKRVEEIACEMETDATRVDLIFTVLWTAKEAVAKCVDIPVVEVCKKYDMSYLLTDLFSEADSMSIELEVQDWDGKNHSITVESEIFDDFAISVAFEL